MFLYVHVLYILHTYIEQVLQYPSMKSLVSSTLYLSARDYPKLLGSEATMELNLQTISCIVLNSLVLVADFNRYLVPTYIYVQRQYWAGTRYVTM